MIEDNEKMVVTPWEVRGVVDYDKLIEQFGVQPMTPNLAQRITKHAGYMHMQLRRGIYLSHRDVDWWMSEYEKGNRVGLYTGRGPSGHVHLGHLLPWFFCKYLQDAFDADLYFQMTDDEKFVFDDHLTLDQTIGYTYDNALDVIACGLSPEKTHIFSDTDHIQHLYKIALRVSKRVTYSTAKAVFGFKDSDNIGMIWYPALQAMTCFLESDREGENIPCLIPAAIDQDPYWRMTRDIAEKMGYYKPAQIHAKFLPGLGKGGKMSSSMPETAIFTKDLPEAAAKKVMLGFTGGQATVKEQRELGGDPTICSIYAYALVCGDCKARLAKVISSFLTDFQAKREKAKDVLADYIIK
jgi:tryptophanyl-tRNA synthetase